jgi:uncharacterized protein (TIGR00369 family)
MSFEPQDPDFEAKVRDSYDRQNFMKHIGAEMTEVRPGYVVIEMPVRPELTQHHGYVHAGATTTIADVAGGFAADTLNPPGFTVLTVEFKMSLVAPAGGESLRAIARVLKPGRRITTCDIDVFAIQADGSEKICAKMLQTMMCVEVRAEQAPMPETKI